ncbi:MAG: hypothetical protein UY96_C0012G0019, partial [Parcubacteria group bacterium GW2011_GWB1_56_8]
VDDLDAVPVLQDELLHPRMRFRFLAAIKHADLHHLLQGRVNIQVLWFGKNLFLGHVWSTKTKARKRQEIVYTIAAVLSKTEPALKFNAEFRFFALLERML